jgi:hypothetical protein
MASDPTIKAALEAGARAICFGGTAGDQCDRCVSPAACTSWQAWRPAAAACSCVMAFELEDVSRRVSRGTLAAAVEEAARDE